MGANEVSQKPTKEQLKTIDSLTQELKNIHNKKIKPFMSTKIITTCGLPSQIVSYLSFSYYRIQELCAEAIATFKENKTICSILLTRALLESSLAVNYIKWFLYEAVASNNETKLLKIMKQLTCGTKIEAKHDGSCEKSINVLSFIADKNNSYVGYDIKDIYNLLCEYSHPNALGVSVHYFYTVEKISTSTNILEINKIAGQLNIFMRSICLKGLKKSLEMCKNNYVFIFDNIQPLMTILLKKQ